MKVSLRNCLKWIFEYMKGTMSYGTMFSSEYGDPSIVIYVDSDYVGDMDDRRSLESCTLAHLHFRCSLDSPRSSIIVMVRLDGERK